MKKVIWKFFVNYEKEEAWLNEMSANGLAFTDFFFCRYVFNDSLPGEYIYRIELLENRPNHEESRRYIKFMTENNVDYMASWLSWVYFRKKAEDGSFDIYSDIDSRIAHYKRIGRLWLCIAVVEMCLGFSQIGPVLHYFSSDSPMISYISINLFAISLALGLAALLLLGWNSMRRRIKKLKLAKSLWE